MFKEKILTDFKRKVKCHTQHFLIKISHYLLIIHLTNNFTLNNFTIPKGLLCDIFFFENMMI